MGSILLPIIPGTLPQGECPPTLQGLLNLFADNLQALLENGRSFYNIGDTKPAPELQAYPWINTAFRNLIFVFQGVWRCPTGYDLNERRLWVGDVTQLVSYDGGSAGAVTPTTGPMWIEDSDAQGRVPMSPGLIPGTTTPAKTLTVGEQYGSGEHTLTEAEGSVGAHIHLTGKSDPTAAAAAFAKNGSAVTVPTYSGYYIGGNAPQPFSETTADMTTLPSGVDGKGVTPTPFSIVQPVIGIYVIKPSGRLYYTVP